MLLWTPARHEYLTFENYRRRPPLIGVTNGASRRSFHVQGFKIQGSRLRAGNALPTTPNYSGVSDL